MSYDETKEAGRHTVLEVDGGESLYRCNSGPTLWNNLPVHITIRSLKDKVSHW